MSREMNMGDFPWPLLRRYRPALLVIILMSAAAFRFVGLNNGTPPGLEHDEVAHWLINRDILAGNHAIYFTDAYGHEALYHYLQAIFGALVGDHAVGLRLPSAYFGVLLVAVSYALGRRLFGWQAGLFSAAFLAVLFWPVFYSRLALRAISLPVFSGLAAYFWWGGFPQPSRVPAQPRQVILPALAGLFAGLSLHTYMAARAVPIFFVVFTIYLLLFHRDQIRSNWRGLMLFWLVFALVALPLVWFLWANPGAESRISEVDAPLRALRAGDLRPILENGAGNAAMFGFRGDPLWRQNIAFKPVFDPIMATLFYLGVGLSVWRWRQSRFAFLILWLFTAAIPSLVTIDAPSSIRIVNLLPVLMLFPAVFIHKMVNLSTVREKFSTILVTGVAGGLVLALLGYTAWTTAAGLWREWPANEEVQFVWQAALTEAAAYLDTANEKGSVAVGGWTPETMDEPTMALTLKRDDLPIRYFDPTESLIIPATASAEPARIIRPAILPLATELATIPGTPVYLPADAPPGRQFALYEVANPPELDIPHPVGADFGGELILLGYDIARPCSPEGTCAIVTYWQVIAPPEGPRRLFLHRVDSTGEIIAQDDRLGAPAEHWRPGDIVVQLLRIEPGEGALLLGVYNPVDGQRLMTATGDAIELIGLDPD